MQRILSSQLATHVGERVTIAGWAHRRRLLKSVAFLIVRDRAGLAQVVVAEPATRDLMEKLTEETIVEVEGEVVANAAAPAGVELINPVVRAPHGAAASPPFDLYRPQLTATLPTMLDHAAVALRHAPRQQAFRLSAAAVAGFRASLDADGFVEVHTPKVVASATESGANVFSLDWFGRPAYLAQSPQFYKQTLVGVFERVYEVGPVFRAEPHDTVRHLAQYTSLDVELGFIRDHRDVMRVLRTVLAAMTASVAQREPGAVAALGLSLPEVPRTIPEVHFADALALVGAALGEDLSAEPDLAPAHERWLGEWARREHGSDFLFVTGYPMAKRPFYTHPDPARPAYSNGFDLLFRGIELVTGGQRLHRYEDYVAALAAAGEPLEPYESYVEVFRHGMPPHGGFAIGLERFMMRLLAATNVREVTLFPRDLHRLTP
ncbi:aspartate--tRNA(Asn) ligase [Luedemannella helvata]|uniref:Aspartate--tRNA(Asp/Asn) ligase n=1 Tax=Luedemannella helvata TaxID=349315 RepID=A0ABP4W426_9ACTN